MEIDFSDTSDSELSQLFDDSQFNFGVHDENPKAEAVLIEIFNLVQFWVENLEDQSSVICYQNALILLLYLGEVIGKGICHSGLDPESHKKLQITQDPGSSPG